MDLPPAHQTESDNGAVDIESLRSEIDVLDAQIIDAIKARGSLVAQLKAHRQANGDPSVVHNEGIRVLEKFSELGSEGKDIGLLLLRHGRGGSGHKK